ncbi:cbb3-type cytochrome oxidase assembly protein CcoS [Colwellia sp. E150_009]|jgi:cbb3-type cytochrome oxidase maturation protein
MSIIYILIPIAVLLTALGIYLFFWAVKTEQFEDLEKQGMSILFDDAKDESNNKSQVTHNTDKQQETVNNQRIDK